MVSGNRLVIFVIFDELSNKKIFKIFFSYLIFCITLLTNSYTILEYFSVEIESLSRTKSRVVREPGFLAPAALWLPNFKNFGYNKKSFDFE